MKLCSRTYDLRDNNSINYTLKEEFGANFLDDKQVARYPQAKYNTSRNRKQSMTKFCNIYDEKLFLYNKSKGTTSVA
jgi:hypothetical protein